MTVYFITELDNSLAGRLFVKIGRSQALARRIANLQTGNRRRLALMGQRTGSISEDRAIEQRLHELFDGKVDALEWFSLSADDVISALKLYSSRAYIAVGQDAFGFL